MQCYLGFYSIGKHLFNSLLSFIDFWVEQKNLFFYLCDVVVDEFWRFTHKFGIRFSAHLGNEVLRNNLQFAFC